MKYIAKIYICIISISGILLGVDIIRNLYQQEINIVFLLFVLLIMTVLSYSPVKLSRIKELQILVDISEIGVIFLIPVSGLIGILPTTLAVFIADFLRYFYKKRDRFRWDAIIFNASMTSISYNAAFSLYVLLSGGHIAPVVNILSASVLILIGLFHFFVIQIILVPIITMSTGISPYTIIRDYLLKELPLKFLFLPIAALSAYFWFTKPEMLILLIFLVGFAYYALSMWLEARSLNTQLSELNNELNALVDQRTAELRGALEQMRGIQEISGREVQHVAHDLRNALGEVHGLVAGSPVAERVAALLRYVEHLIEDMLLASALKKPEFALEPRAADLLDVINDVIAALPDDVVRLRVVCATPDAQVWADAPRLQRVLHNIIGNAVKHGATQIVLRIEDGGAQHLRLTVRDNGAGIAPEQLALVRERVAAPDTPGGYRIGLRASSLLMRRSSGALAIDSEGVFCGTSVTLALPRPAAVQGQQPYRVSHNG